MIGAMGCVVAAAASAGAQRRENYDSFDDDYDSFDDDYDNVNDNYKELPSDNYDLRKDLLIPLFIVISILVVSLVLVAIFI